MIGKVLWEGLGLGVLLVLVCAFGIRKGAVGMVHLYHEDVQERCVEMGLTTHGRIKRNSKLFKLCCVPGYLAYVLVFVYAVNGARGFWAGFRRHAGVCPLRPYARCALPESFPHGEALRQRTFLFEMARKDSALLNDWD